MAVPGSCAAQGEAAKSSFPWGGVGWGGNFLRQQLCSIAQSRVTSRSYSLAVGTHSTQCREVRTGQSQLFGVTGSNLPSPSDSKPQPSSSSLLHLEAPSPSKEGTPRCERPLGCPSSLPRGEWSQRCSEARYAPRPSLPESLLYQFAFRGRVYPPEGTFAWFFLGTWYFDEITIQREIVAN